MSIDAKSPDLVATTTVNAAPAQVWATVTDVARMPKWSPQVVKTVVLGGPVRLGTRFVNLNRQRWKRWPTTAKVVRFAPHEDFAFKIPENWAVWSFQMEPVDGGTRLTHRRELPDGIRPAARVLEERMMGGLDEFTAELEQGMQQTVERIKAEVER